MTVLTESHHFISWSCFCLLIHFLAFVFYLRSMTLVSASASLLALSGLQPVTFLTPPWFIPSVTRLASCGRSRKTKRTNIKVSAAAVFHPLQMLLWWQMLTVAPGGSEYYRVCRGQRSQSSNLWKNQSYKGATEVQRFYRPIICWHLGLI